MPAKKRPPPGFMKDLWEKDPARALAACRKGGQNSSRGRKNGLPPVSDASKSIWTVSEATRLAEAAEIAAERNDCGDLIPPDL